MKVLPFIQVIGMLGGIICVLTAMNLRTDEHPVTAKGSLMSPFKGQRDWWRPPGYALHKIGYIAFFGGALAGAIYYWPYMF